MRTLLTTLLLFFGVANTSLAADEGIPVTVVVLDEAGAPVPTAVVRHPQEADRHRVNTETGRWTDKILYLPNGDELVFVKNMELEFEVSAPGYQNQVVKYIVRKRKNIITVTLVKMSFEDDDEESEDEIIIQFGRDKPLDR
jgi:hypothetical protein